MKLPRLLILCKYLVICFFSLSFLFIFNTSILGGAVYPCDNPATPEIEYCEQTCDDAGDCNCRQSSACIDSGCSCTVDGIGGSGWEYCSDCVDGYRSCSNSSGRIHEIQICREDGGGPVICHAPGAVQDNPINCEGGVGSFNTLEGFVYRQYYTFLDPSDDDPVPVTYLTRFGLTCTVASGCLGCSNPDVYGWLNYLPRDSGWFAGGHPLQKQSQSLSG